MKNTIAATTTLLRTVRRCGSLLILAGTLALSANCAAATRNAPAAQWDVLTGAAAISLSVNESTSSHEMVISLRHNFHGLATVHLHLKVTDTAGQVSFMEISGRGHAGIAIPDASLHIANGSGILVMAVDARYEEWGQHYRLTVDENHTSLSRDGRDYSYAKQYSLLQPSITIVPAQAPKPGSRSSTDESHGIAINATPGK